MEHENKGEEAETQIRSQAYAAPEILDQYKYSKEVDMYSLGVLLHFLINLEENHQNIDQESKELKSKRRVSEDLETIRVSMLEKDTSERISLKKILK